MAWNRIKNFFGLGDSEENYTEEISEEPFPSRRRKPLISLHRRREEEIFVRFPKSFEEAKEAADYLKDRHVIILNLEETSPDEARRVVDFLSGVAYALDGHSEKISELIFLFTPSHFFVSK